MTDTANNGEASIIAALVVLNKTMRQVVVLSASVAAIVSIVGCWVVTSIHTVELRDVLQSQISETRNTVATNQGHVATLRQDLTETRSTVSSNRVRILDIQSQLLEILSTVSKNNQQPTRQNTP